jgi:hypothetical protein
MLKKMTTKGSKPTSSEQHPSRSHQGPNRLLRQAASQGPALHPGDEHRLGQLQDLPLPSEVRAGEPAEDWKAFYWARRREVYKQRQVQVPGTRYSPLSYTEILNVLFFFRPHEISFYLRTLPLANNYAFCVEAISTTGDCSPCTLRPLASCCLTWRRGSSATPSSFSESP